MKTQISGLALGALLSLSSAAIARDAPDLVVGTWHLNLAKSTGNAPLPKSETRTYASTPYGIALTWKRESADGKNSIVSTTFKYDGKDYPVTGSPDLDTLNAKRVDANTIESTLKRMGKDIGTAKRTVSTDGKMLTLDSKLTTTKNDEVTTTYVYDRQ